MREKCVGYLPVPCRASLSWLIKTCPNLSGWTAALERGEEEGSWSFPWLRLTQLLQGWQWSRGEQGWAQALPSPARGAAGPSPDGKATHWNRACPVPAPWAERASRQPHTQAPTEQLLIPPSSLGREGHSWNEGFLELRSSIFFFSFHFFHCNLVVFSRVKSWRQWVLYILRTLDAIQLP